MDVNYFVNAETTYRRDRLSRQWEPIRRRRRRGEYAGRVFRPLGDSPE